MKALDVSSFLVNKIINGGSGVWGETVMPGHVDLSEDDAERIVNWILSLNEEETNGTGSPPAEGTIDPTQGKQATPNGLLILSASYTDRGSVNTKPLTGSTSIYLRNSSLSLENAATFDGNFLVMVPEGTGSFSLNDIDLTGVGSVTIMSVTPEPLPGEVQFELRLDSPAGQLVGQASYQPGDGFESPQGILVQNLTFELSSQSDGNIHDLYIVSRRAEGASGTYILSNVQFSPAQ